MPTGSRRKTPLRLRLYNGAQKLRSRLRGGPTPFRELEESFHEQARQSVGFEDFGDPGYREGLRVLLEAYDTEARLTPFGRRINQGQILGILRNRLRSEQAWQREPTVLEGEIRRPIFILGLPRTGTTALHHLLGQDPGLQSLEYWLAASPQPRPPRAEWETHPDFKKSVRELEGMYALDPSLKAMHLMSVDGPEECRHLLQQSFTDDTFDCNATIPSYSAWYARADMRPTYRRHRDLLKLIGSPRPERRWILKYPVHMRNLDTVFEIYPDACVVQTHRDPARVLPSLCSLVAGWRSLYEENVDSRAIAEGQIELWAAGMEQAIEVRKRHDRSHFFDLDFRELLSDPIDAVKRVYAHFEIPWTEAGERRMRLWRAENPRGKYGEHRYSIEEFGLTEARIADRYAAYMEHFGLRHESPT